MSKRDDQLKLVVFVPDAYRDPVKQAVFAAGAGGQGLYDCCAFEQPGYGQFRPLAGSAPFLGSADTLERVEEWRIEMLVPRARLSEVITALRHAHPYEEPAFDIFERVAPPK